MNKRMVNNLISIVFIFLGLLCLLYPSYLSYTAKKQQQAFIASLEEYTSRDASSNTELSTNLSNIVIDSNDSSFLVSDESVGSADTTISYSIGDLLGTLSIPSLEVESVIVEGTSAKELELGIGHIVGSGLFDGNTALAAHRATYFKQLDKLSIGDSIILKDLSEETYEYIVYETFVVSPKDVWVVEKTEEDIVTLVTCTNGNRDRFIVRGKR